MVTHLTDKALNLYALGRFSDETSLVESHLGICQLCRDKLTTEAERRADPRIASDDPAIVMCVNPVSEEWTIRIIDVSRKGMCLRTGRFIEPGAAVKVRSQKFVAFGVVRYCVGVAAEFHAGIKLTQVVERTAG